MSSDPEQRLNSPPSGYGSTINNSLNSKDIISFDSIGHQFSPSVLHTSRDPTFLQSLSVILYSSKLNLLLILVPFGFLAHILGLSDITIFILNFFAIIPLAKLIGFATEDVSLRVGQIIGGLLNVTFGNAVELIISITALYQGEIRVVQASMLGSIISNLLLVLGMCFVAGGIYYEEQTFNTTAAQTSSSLMALACAGLALPAAFHFTIGSEDGEGFIHNKVLSLSHGTALVLLAVYVLYLYFQLKTHAYLYIEVAQEDAESEDPQLSLGVALFTLAIATVIVAFAADYLVGSIEGIVEASGLSKTFVGFILLPIVGNAAEHVTAITVAMKNKMDLAIAVAIGSSMQIALFMTPLLVVLGWIIGQPMSLYFQTFETVVTFISVLITNYLIQDGKSNWLEGAMSIATYVIIAMAFFFYPDDVTNKV